MNRKLRTQISPKPEVAKGSNLAGRCGRRRPATVQNLQGLAQKGAPPEFFEILGKFFGTKSVDHLQVTVMDGGPPNYFYPIENGPGCALESYSTLPSRNFAPHEFSKLVQKWSFFEFPVTLPPAQFRASLQLCTSKKSKLAAQKISRSRFALAIFYLYYRSFFGLCSAFKTRN